MTDYQLAARWQRVQRDHLDYVATHRGRVPQGMIDELVALRREGYRRGIDMEAIPPAPRDPRVIRRKLASVERSMRRLHRPVSTRAQATTREARLGQLAVLRDGLVSELQRVEGLKHE